MSRSESFQRQFSVAARRSLLFGLIALLVLSPFPASSAQAAVDDLVIEQRLIDEVPKVGGEFTQQIAMDGDRLVAFAGGWGRPNELRYYRRQATRWSLQRTINLARDIITDIDLSGSTLVVGTPYTGTGTRTGQVRIYDLSTLDAAPVILSDDFVPPSELYYWQFGTSVAVDGSRIMVAVKAESLRFAMFYERSGATWALAPGGQHSALLAAIGAYESRVDISGGLAVVSVEDSVYVYRRLPRGWALEERVSSPYEFVGGESGALISGETLLLSPTDEKVYVLRRGAASRWEIKQQLSVPGRTATALSAGELAVLDFRGLVQVWDRRAAGWVKGPSFHLSQGGVPFHAWPYTLSVMSVSGGRVAVAVPEPRQDLIHDAQRVTILRRS